MQLTATTLDVPPSSGGGRGAIMIVEDDEDLRCLCIEVLEAAGFVVLPCRDIASAMRTLVASIPGLILLDRELDDGDGLEIARWIRERGEYADVRILAFTARKSPEDIHAAIVAGCHGFLAKPSTPAALVAQIRAMRLHDDDPTTGPFPIPILLDSMVALGNALVET